MSAALPVRDRFQRTAKGREQKFQAETLPRSNRARWARKWSFRPASRGGERGSRDDATFGLIWCSSIANPTARLSRSFALARTASSAFDLTRITGKISVWLAMGKRACGRKRKLPGGRLSLNDLCESVGDWS